MRRRVLLAASVAVALAASRGGAGDDDEWERPFDGVLPEPEEDVSVNPPEAGVETPLPRAAACIVDGATGKPVPGATLTLFPEDVAPDVTSYATAIGAGKADASGVAWLDASGSTDGGHWIAEAPGYAPTHVVGLRPPPRMALARGMDIAGCLVDGMGRAVAGVEVDAYLGCEHSGTLRRVKSAKDGTFTLTSMPPGETQIWIASAAGCVGFEQSLGRLGRRVSDVLVKPSTSVRGRFVDADGGPVPGVVLRGTSFERAPVAVSGADGRFELVGFPTREGIRGRAPGALSDFVIDDRNLTPLPRTITLDGEGQPVVPEHDAKFALTVATADGAGIPLQRVRLTRVSDGYTFTVRMTDDDEDELPGSVAAEIPSGTYDVAPDGPPAGTFGRAVFPPFRWEIAKGATAERVVVATWQPALALRGRIPENAHLTLSVPGDDWPRSVDLDSWAARVPAEGPAVVAVQPQFAGRRVVFFFPVGPERNGVRAVHIDVPPPHRVRIAGTGKLRVERFTCDGFDVAHESDGPVLSTYAEGPMVLDANVGGVVRRFAFDLPPATEGDLVLDPATAPVVAPPGIVRVVAEGKGARVRVEGGSVSISGGTSAESPPPCRVIVTRPGHQPFDRTFAQAAEVRHVWGPCSLRLVVRDESDAAAPSIVQVDGVTHWTDDGALDLAGLASGPHDVAVSPVRGDLAGRELRIVLAEDESRARDVVLPKR